MNANWILAALVSTAVIVLKVAILRRWVKRVTSGPEFTGAPVQGTARILSAPEPRYEHGITEAHCEIGLRVQLPGRRPYNAKTYQLVDLDILPLLPGATVVVNTDSANPKYVRIDFDQPIGPAPDAGG